MTRIDRTRYLDKGKYTLYGRWFLFACFLVGIDQKEAARRMDVDAGAISKHITVGKSEPERESVIRAIRVFHSVALEKGKAWDMSWAGLILHAAGLATDQEMEESELRLAALIAQHPQEG